MPFIRSESCSFIWHPKLVTWYRRSIAVNVPGGGVIPPRVGELGSRPSGDRQVALHPRLPVAGNGAIEDVLAGSEVGELDRLGAVRERLHLAEDVPVRRGDGNAVRDRRGVVVGDRGVARL